MKVYSVEFTQDAREDFKRLLYVIAAKYKAPLTAKKYTTELIAEINNLTCYAESIPECNQTSIIKKYGINIRRVNYKKMAIIYTVIYELIVIEAIIPQAIIYELTD
jgi:plasmid stabilization system protein ParE